VSVTNEDIVAWDGGGGVSVTFDGSDVGLSALAIDAFARVGPSQILLSFSAAGTVPGVPGTVDDSDVVLFTATSLGATTAGTFAMYLDGSDVGLTTSGEDIDAVELLADGRIVLSTSGDASVPGAAAGDEDLLMFTPTSLGTTTAGTWALHFDGSDVGLSATAEDIDAAAIGADGRIYLSTLGAFSVPGRTGANDDVFVFAPTSLGATTSGTFEAALVLDGTALGLDANDVGGIDLP